MKCAAPFDWLHPFEEFGDGGLTPIIGGKIFFQKLIGPMLFKQPTDESVVNKAINEELPPLFNYLESELGSGDWLVGGRFSVADIGVGTDFAQATFVGLSPDAKRWPKLAAYVGRVLGRPSFADAIGKAKAMLGWNPREKSVVEVEEPPRQVIMQSNPSAAQHQLKW